MLKSRNVWCLLHTGHLTQCILLSIPQSLQNLTGLYCLGTSGRKAIYILNTGVLLCISVHTKAQCPQNPGEGAGATRGGAGIKLKCPEREASPLNQEVSFSDTFNLNSVNSQM